MSEIQTSKRLHPLMAAAAASVITVSLVGVAAMTGILPTSNSAPKTDTPVAASLATDITNASSASVAAESLPAATRSSSAVKVATADTGRAQQHIASKHEPGRSTYVQPVCESCGVVESVRHYEQPAAQGSGLGAVAGAVLGGVLGNQVGGGNGRSLATVAGAVGGGFAGNAIEKRTRTNSVYEVRVRMENGHIRTFHPSSTEWRSGDHVRVVDGNLVSAS
ncbi:MAG: glycine zipper 2TM domain-containing protein [Burkholderiales bacterium]|nr:glycine zipper 2TM domain-containing protein [Burkholderiales bacterium]